MKKLLIHKEITDNGKIKHISKSNIWENIYITRKYLWQKRENIYIILYK